MRDAIHARTPARFFCWLILVCLLPAVSGCVGAGSERPQNSGGGSGSPEALYRQGRDLEQRVAANPDEARANLQSARSAYVQALRQNPTGRLDAYLRTALGNVAYFQDDYATALEQWSIAYPRLDRPELKSWCLWRIGLCQQRLGRFDEADATFAMVQQHYAGSVPAQRAREQQGARAFHVQLGVFNSPAGADSAVSMLRNQGVVPVRTVDGMGRQVVRVGPIPTYSGAQALKAQLSGWYPDAFIVP